MKIGIFDILLIIFITAKITNNTDMTWFQVFIPLYIYLILYLLPDKK